METVQTNPLHAGHTGAHSEHRVCWRAIIAGVVAGMIVQVILTLLGTAIGLNALDPTGIDSNAKAVGIVSILWLLISAIASGFTGDWVTSFVSNLHYRMDGILHGAVYWGVFMLIATYLLGTGVGNLIGGAFNLTDSTIQSRGPEAVQEQVMEGGNKAQTGASQHNEGDDDRHEKAADSAAGATWVVFLTALLSLAASIIGGITGIRDRKYSYPNY